MALARARRDGGMNYWPGFVDALSTLILGIIFLLTVFAVVQFYLTQEVTGKDTALNRLNAQIAQLTDLLSLEKTGKLNLEEQLSALQSSLATAEGERERYKGLYEGIGSGAAAAQGKAAELGGQLDAEKRLTARALAQVEVLNQQISALRRQLAALEEALDASEKQDKEAQTRIADLGQRLNVALAQRVQELSRYRSDFFGRLRAILGNRPNIRIVGDRFVFQSEVFFDTGKATLDKPEGLTELDGPPPRCSSSKGRFRARSPGCCASTATPTCGRSTARNSRTTGSFPPDARSRSCNTSSARACRRGVSWPRVSANSSRSIPIRRRRPSAATAASSSS
jgi:chemotaxis protein MotB